MKNHHKFLILIVILVICAYLISALESYLDIVEPPKEEKTTEKPPVIPAEPVKKPEVAGEKPLEKEKTECEQEGGICRCDCLETEYGGYGRLGCALFGCGFFNIESYKCCKPKGRIEIEVKEISDKEGGALEKQAETEKQELVCPEECQDKNDDNVVDIFDMTKVAEKISSIKDNIQKSTAPAEKERLSNTLNDEISNLICVARDLGRKCDGVAIKAEIEPEIKELFKIFTEEDFEINPAIQATDAYGNAILLELDENGDIAYVRSLAPDGAVGIPNEQEIVVYKNYFNLKNPKENLFAVVDRATKETIFYDENALPKFSTDADDSVSSYFKHQKNNNGQFIQTIQRFKDSSSVLSRFRPGTIDTKSPIWQVYTDDKGFKSIINYQLGLLYEWDLQARVLPTGLIGYSGPIERYYDETDAQGNIVKTIVFGQGEIRTHDGNGDLISLTDRKGKIHNYRIVEYHYNGRQKSVQELDEDNKLIAKIVMAEDGIIDSITKFGATTHFAINSKYLNGIVEELLEKETQTKYQFDYSGKLTARVFKDGSKNQLSYFPAEIGIEEFEADGEKLKERRYSLINGKILWQVDKFKVKSFFQDPPRREEPQDEQRQRAAALAQWLLQQQDEQQRQRAAFELAQLQKKGQPAQQVEKGISVEAKTSFDKKSDGSIAVTTTEPFGLPDTKITFQPITNVPIIDALLPDSYKANIVDKEIIVKKDEVKIKTPTREEAFSSTGEIKSIKKEKDGKIIKVTRDKNGGLKVTEAISEFAKGKVVEPAQLSPSKGDPDYFKKVKWDGKTGIPDDKADYIKSIYAEDGKIKTATKRAQATVHNLWVGFKETKFSKAISKKAGQVAESRFVKALSTSAQLAKTKFQILQAQNAIRDKSPFTSKEKKAKAASELPNLKEKERLLESKYAGDYEKARESASGFMEVFEVVFVLKAAEVPKVLLDFGRVDEKFDQTVQGVINGFLEAGNIALERITQAQSFSELKEEVAAIGAEWLGALLPIEGIGRLAMFARPIDVVFIPVAKPPIVEPLVFSAETNGVVKTVLNLKKTDVPVYIPEFPAVLGKDVNFISSNIKKIVESGPLEHPHFKTKLGDMVQKAIIEQRETGMDVYNIGGSAVATSVRVEKPASTGGLPQYHIEQPKVEYLFDLHFHPVVVWDALGNFLLPSAADFKSRLFEYQSMNYKSYVTSPFVFAWGEPKTGFGATVVDTSKLLRQTVPDAYLSPAKIVSLAENGFEDIYPGPPRAHIPAKTVVEQYEKEGVFQFYKLVDETGGGIPEEFMPGAKKYSFKRITPDEAFEHMKEVARQKDRIISENAARDAYLEQIEYKRALTKSVFDLKEDLKNKKVELLSLQDLQADLQARLKRLPQEDQLSIYRRKDIILKKEIAQQEARIKGLERAIEEKIKEAED